MKMKKGPSWILRYKDEIESRKITPEEILARENKRRRKPIKLATVKRAMNFIVPSISEYSREVSPDKTVREVKHREKCDLKRPYGKGASGQNIFYCGKYDLVIGEKAKLCKGCEEMK